MEYLPGMTRRWPGPADSVVPYTKLLDLKPLVERKIVLLATASITDANIFNNGLYQNIFVFYRLIEAIGFLPIFIVNSKPKNLADVPEILRSCRVADVDDLVKTPMPIYVYIEIGMSVHQHLKRFLKMLGAKTAKLYLGNILNIDIETPMFFNPMFFSHHVVGETTEIWVSPHYYQHAEYAAALNHVTPGSPQQKVAPYVWDPCIITDDGRRNVRWRPRTADEKLTFIIMEPNISFQKNSIGPLMICEEFALAHPEVDFEILLINGDRLLLSSHFKNNILPYLEIFKKNRIQFAPRKDMVSVLKSLPHAIGVCYHLNNEFNYMVLEYISAGYPCLHNCTAWKDYGYYYPDIDTRKGAEQLHAAVNFHGERIETYNSHAKSLLWRHSPYNPDIQKAWKHLLDGTDMPHEDAIRKELELAKNK